MNPRFAVPALVIIGVIAIGGCAGQEQDLPLDDSAVPDSSEIIFVPYQYLYDGYAGYGYDVSFCEPMPRPGPTCGGIEPATNPIGGSPPYSFSVGYGAGVLPPGMRMNLNGVLEGTPTLAGNYDFEICARDGAGNSDCNTFSLRVREPLYMTVYWAGDGSGAIGWNTALGNSTCAETTGGLGDYKCAVPVAYDSYIYLVPEADEISEFAGWSGACSGAGICNISMTEDTDVAGRFDLAGEIAGTTPDTTGGSSAQAGNLDVTIDSASLTKCNVVQGGWDDGMRYYTVAASGTATGGDSDRTTSLNIGILETRNGETTSYGTDTLDCGVWTWTNQDGYTYPYCYRAIGQPETTTWTVAGKGAGSNMEHMIGVSARVNGYENGESSYDREERDAGTC